MNEAGLILCSRFAYPPNSYSLCGPSKQNDFRGCVAQKTVDAGLREMLTQFATLYPYLCLIAGQNGLTDPFDYRVVEAYWIGNSLLNSVSLLPFIDHLSNNLALKRHLASRELSWLLAKLPLGGRPHHAFHVLNVWRRTGHNSVYHTLQTMEACLISWGKVINILPGELLIESRPLMMRADRLLFGTKKQRSIKTFHKNTHDQARVHVGDWIAYHWGLFCSVLTLDQLRRLVFYTQKALNLANSFPSYEKKTYLYLG